MTYEIGVSRDRVCLALLIVVLNDFDILSGDTQNAHLKAPTKEKVFFYAGDEWKSYRGKLVLLLELSMV